MPPTLIVHAGRVLAGADLVFRGATSVAVHGCRVTAVGTRARIGRLRGRDTRVLDVPRSVLMPAFTDAHTHFHSWACRPDVADLVGVSSLDGVLRLLSRAARERRPGEWVIARGFDKNQWQREPHAETRRGEVTGVDALPCAADLDAVTGTVPARIESRDGHTVWVNTAALKLAGITPRTRAPAGGMIVRDARGRPTGILQENAIGLLPDVQTALTDAQIERALLAGIRQAHRYGITCVHSVEGREAMRWFQRLHSDGKLGLRIRFAMPAEHLDHAIALGLTAGLGDDMLRICGVKAFADGALGSQTAYMFDPYPTRHGYRGVPVTIGRALRELVCKASRAGLPCWVHAIGDRANHEVLDVFAAARRAEPRPLAHRIEHAQCVRPADARRMGRLGIIASMQPCHIVGDIDTAERHWSNVLRWTYPVRSLLNAGVTLAFGSDVPVETIDPIIGLHAAVNRQTLDRRPPSGWPLTNDAALPLSDAKRRSFVKGWHMHQAIGVRDALHAYTAGGAVAAGDGDRLGRIAPGMLADFVLLSDDPLQIPRERLLDLRVVATVCNGRMVYRE